MAVLQSKQIGKAGKVGNSMTPFNFGQQGGSSLWPSLGAASAVQGITAGLAQSSENSSYKLQAEQYEQQKLMAAQNEKLAKMAVANAYSSGAYQAMMQGLQDAQIISQTRASRAGSGVRMGVGSAREIEASQRISAALNQTQIQRNTTAAAVNAKLQQTNYQVEQIIIPNILFLIGQCQEFFINGIQIFWFQLKSQHLQTMVQCSTTTTSCQGNNRLIQPNILRVDNLVIGTILQHTILMNSR